MDIRLDTERNLVIGSELLTWTNTSEKPTEELWFHLYWNAFQNNMSTFIRERTLEGRPLPPFSKDDWGYCRVSNINMILSESEEEFDLTPFMEFRQPDDDNILDQTVFSVELPEPLEPGQTVTLSIDFHAKVPRPISRTGVYKNYYFIAQWFPKIGVLQDGIWNCHQYHSHSEYFADYGTYDVAITLPSSYIVGATGEQREEVANGDGTTTHRFVQHSVHDFAWTASSRFLVYREIFQFAPAISTEITLLLQPYHKRLKDRYMNAVKNAIKYASLWYGDYPYTTVTCVDPAYNSHSGGMEYPTLFTGGAYFLDPLGSGNPESVTIHEFGHGYFFGLLGSNEFEHAWMDEGMASFLDTEIYYTAYGEPYSSKRYFGIPVLFKEARIPIELDEYHIISEYRRMSDRDNMQRFSWKFMSGASYTSNVYFKSELMMRTLKRYLGADVFARMIKDYSEKWWFSHPQPKDFYQVVSTHAGQDMSWLLNQLVYGSDSLDYAITSIENRDKRRPKGWFDGIYREVDRDPPVHQAYESEVLVRRLGGVKIPVDVLIVFDDGKEIIENWDGQYRWKKYVYSGPVKIKRAIVDPDFKLVLDIDRTNNSWAVKPDNLAPWKWTSTWLLWLQHALECLSFLGS
ncbi:M1 family metallopeptidase [Acidobacteriota bacterium]